MGNIKAKHALAAAVAISIAALLLANREPSPLDEREAIKSAELLQQQFDSEGCVSGLKPVCREVLSKMRAVARDLPQGNISLTETLSACREAEQRSFAGGDMIPPPPPIPCG